MRTLLFILTILLLAVSCGQKGEVVKAKFKIFSGNIINPQVTFPGGLLVMGRSLDNLQSFIIPYSTGLELELKKGSWEFATIGWMGTTGIMEGNQQCSYQAVDINSDIFTINFNMNYQSCLAAITSDGSRFTDLMFYNQIGGTYNGFKTLNVQTCLNLDTNCTTQSAPISFRVEIPTNFKGIALTTSTGVGSGLTSNCIAGGANSGGLSNISPPHGGSNGFIGMQITTFSDAACTLTPKSYFFKHGFGEVLNQTFPVLTRGALSVNSTSSDAGVALAPFMGGHMDPAVAPTVTVGTKALYITATAMGSGGVPSGIMFAPAGNYLYFDGTNLLSGWSNFASTSSVKLLLQQ